MAERMDMADLMARLRAVVAVYGADSGRWPTAEWHALAAFVETNAEARRLLDDEAAFETVLAAAVTGASAASAARARDSLLARLDEVVGTGAAEAGTVLPFGRRPVPRPSAPAARSFWREAAVLAAALLIGIFTGTQGLIEGSGLDLTVLTPSATSATTESDDISALALGAAGETFSEEDLL